MLKSLWYIYRIKKYEKLIISMTKAREKIKNKQSYYTKQQEKYKELLEKAKEV